MIGEHRKFLCPIHSLCYPIISGPDLIHIFFENSYRLGVTLSHCDKPPTVGYLRLDYRVRLLRSDLEYYSAWTVCGRDPGLPSDS